MIFQRKFPIPKGKPVYTIRVVISQSEISFYETMRNLYKIAESSLF